METIPDRVKVAVIGAGQAGLSVAYYLRRFELVADEDFVMLDRAPGPGGAWQHRWSSLRLGTAHRVNDLPGMGELGISFETADRLFGVAVITVSGVGHGAPPWTAGHWSWVSSPYPSWSLSGSMTTDMSISVPVTSANSAELPTGADPEVEAR